MPHSPSSGPAAPAAPMGAGLSSPPWRRLARWATAAAGGIFSVAVLLWLTLHWGILPRLDQWRPLIEQRAGAAIGVPVRIGAIEVSSGGWVPALALRDVRLLDRRGQPGLHLAELRAAIAPQSLLVAELRLSQLHVSGVDLDIRRDAAGRLHVAGVDLERDLAGTGTHPDEPNPAAEWLLAQSEIVVRSARIRWIDEKRQAPPLELESVDFVLRNGLRRHDFRVDATPPSDWGEAFRLRGQFTAPLLGRRSDWQRWSGSLFAEAPRIDVSQLRQHVDLPFELNQGRGALRTWLELERGQWRAATADVALADVWLRLGASLPPLAVASLSTRFSAERHADGVDLKARALSFTLATESGAGPAARLDWPAADLAFSWQQVQNFSAPLFGGNDDPVTGGRLLAERLDLGLLASIAERLPLGDAVLSAVHELRPLGIASGLEWRWQGPASAPTAYGGKGKLAGLALAASRPQGGHLGRPGFSGADVELQFDERGGRAKLAANGGRLLLPGLFADEELKLDRLSTQLEWRVIPASARGAPAVIELQADDLQFANADAQGDARLKWRTGPGSGFGPGGRYPGSIDLSGRFAQARAERVAAYLPQGLPLPARRYVERAVKSGTLDAGSFAVKGDLWHFPFHHADAPKDSVFRIAGRLRDAGFDPLPSVPASSDEAPWASPWPAFQAVQGDIVFDRSSLKFGALQARLWGVQLRGIEARLDDLAGRPVLQVEGEARGPAADMLRYVDSTPVGDWIGGGLRSLSASGAAELKLALTIPITDSARSVARGSVVLAGNDVRVRPDTPLLAGARGRVDFDQRGFSIRQGHARVFGGEASFDGGTQADGSLRFGGQGVATADGLKRAGELGPLLPAVAQALRGQTAYRVNLAIVEGRPEVQVTSDLVGLESDLPPPLAKSAAAAWPMRWQTSLQRDTLGALSGARDSARLDIGEIVQLRLLRRLPAAADDATTVLAASLGLNEAPPALAAAAGVGMPAVWQVRSQFEAIDLEAWQRAARRMAGAGDAAAGKADIADPGLPPMKLALRAANLSFGSRRLQNVQLDLTHDPAAGGQRERPAITAHVRAHQGHGTLAWFAPRPDSRNDQGRLVARLGRFVLPEPEPSIGTKPIGAQAVAAESERPPTLDIQVDELVLGERPLGRLELAARPQGPGSWRLESLSLALPGAVVQASGLWSAAAAGNPARMALDFGVDVSDCGPLVARFGMPDTMRGGKGRIEGRLAWPGSPLQPSFASLDGQVRINLEAGQFLRAEPGVARLLGILSLQSLPRRLLLDFRDVFEEGFRFDNVRGDLQVSRGIARTDNLRMRGVQAVVGIAGQADLVQRHQDVKVVVVPEINAGAASLAYAAINPAVALGSFLAQLLLREPLVAANTREFHVSGAWDAPKVERVERSFEAPAPAAGSNTNPPAPARPKEGPG